MCACYSVRWDFWSWTWQTLLQAVWNLTRVRESISTVFVKHLINQMLSKQREDEQSEIYHRKFETHHTCVCYWHGGMTLLVPQRELQTVLTYGASKALISIHLRPGPSLKIWVTPEFEIPVAEVHWRSRIRRLAWEYDTNPQKAWWILSQNVLFIGQWLSNFIFFIIYYVFSMTI